MKNEKYIPSHLKWLVQIIQLSNNGQDQYLPLCNSHYQFLRLLLPDGFLIYIRRLNNNNKNTSFLDTEITENSWEFFFFFLARIYHESEIVTHFSKNFPSSYRRWSQDHLHNSITLLSQLSTNLVPWNKKNRFPAINQAHKTTIEKFETVSSKLRKMFHPLPWTEN